ncbi:MAG: hypothetical protein NVSMB63_16750 [Sediminibacterium sp.]
MKKIIFASAAALIFSMSAMAQTTPSADKKQDMKDMRKDIRDIRKDKAERRRELKEGDKQGAKKLTEDIKADKKDMHHDAKDLRKDGVKHPIHRAEKQIHRQNEKRNG